MKSKLAIVTGNALKYREISAALSEFFEYEQKEVSGYEIQGTLDEIVAHKLDHAYKTLQMPVLVDDTGLYFEALHGFPGPYAKDFFKVMTPFEMGVFFENTRIKAVCNVGIKLSDTETIFAQGIVSGVVIKPQNNDHHGREFDLFFQADGNDRCMIEYTPEEKNAFSHRGRAVVNLLEKLKYQKNA